MASDKKGRTRSDRPLGDFNKERDAFIQTFFKKGVELTEELLRENARLKERNTELETERAALRVQLKSDDAIRELVKKIEGLEREKHDLLSRYHSAEATKSTYADRYTEVEAELSNLANLYVASSQLGASLSPRTTVRQIKELLEQLVGARSFAVYVVDDTGRELCPVASQSVDPKALVRIGPGVGPIGDAFAKGYARIEEGSLRTGSLDRPVAIVPMLVDEQVVGVLAVFETLEQKERFLPVDFELFKLLGTHAGSALVSARLFAEHGRVVRGLERLADFGM